PDHPGLLALKAQFDLFDGHPDAALGRLNRAAEADPYRPQTFYQRGLVLRQLGRAAEAEGDAARAAELNQGIAEMWAWTGQAERAPHDAGVRSALGRLCAELGKPELAASWYRAALACDPKHAAAKAGLSALRTAARPGARRAPGGLSP